MEGMGYSWLSVVHDMPKREIHSYITISIIKHLLCAGCCVRKTKICLGDLTDHLCRQSCVERTEHHFEGMEKGWRYAEK